MTDALSDRPGKTLRADSHVGTAGEFALRERYLAEFPPPELSAEEFTWQDYQVEFCPPEATLKTPISISECCREFR